MNPIMITKRDGRIVPFDEGKLRSSLERSGARESLIDRVVTEVEKQLYREIKTSEIYRIAFSLLRKFARPAASRYNLKKALFELGPTGFPFEKYVSELLRCKGFETRTGQFVKGHCVQHEVDVVAEKDHKHFMVECKFHSDQGGRCDVKVPLYINSRFRDVEKEWEKLPGHSLKFHQGWVVTNTRFTRDAIEYGQCVNLFLLSWDYPMGNGLRHWVNDTGAHPLTCLFGISKKEKQLLLDHEIVLCRQLCEQQDKLDLLNISQRRKEKILEEAEKVCRF